MVYPYICLICYLWILLACGQQSYGRPEKRDVISVEEAISHGDEVLDDFYFRYATTPLVDLVFVLDRSGSVPAKGWGAIVNFLYDTLQHFTVDRDNTRVAVVTYSNGVTVDINDLDPTEKNYGNKCSLHSRIEALIESKIPYGYTATHDALDAAYRVLINSRPEAKKAVLVLTDGRSNIGPPPIRATHNILSLEWNAKWNETAMGPQVEIYAFGIKDAYRSELDSIASPLPNHTFLIPTFEAFESFAHKLHGGKQEETWIGVSSADCHTSCSGAHAHCMCGARRGQYACVCEPGYERIGITCKACEQGYYKAGHTLSMCLPCPVNTTTDHTASIRQEDCKLLPGLRACPAIPDVENGVSFFVAGSQKDEVPPTGQPCVDVRNGNSCHYACEEGYWMQGSPIMHCNRSGSWEGSPPNCTLIDCGDPNALFGDLQNVLLTLANGTTTYNSVTEVTCVGGLVPIGRTTWLCDQHEKWTKPWNFLCAEIKCPPLPRIPYSTSSPDTCSRHRQMYGTNCTVECSDGFELVGGATVSCDFDRQAMWDTQTQEWPWCRDTKPPVIICRDDIELMVSDWEDNSTFVHIDRKEDAWASDNSGNFTQWVTGVPPSGLFKVGVHVVTYYAQDSSNLTSHCERKVKVQAKHVNILSCPSDVTEVMNRKDGMLEVTWENPIFLDSMDKELPYTCFPLGPFHVGNHSITCMDSQFQVAKCQFNVVVNKPECSIPSSLTLPPNSAIICGEPPGQLYPRFCRVHCETGYELSAMMGLGPDHSFKCGWDGQWEGLDRGWPKCRRVRRQIKPTTKGQLDFTYNGNCEEEERTIKLSFIEAVITILTQPGRPCAGDVQCTVSNVKVHCGGKRKKRTTEQQASIFFTMFTSMPNATEDTITAAEQTNLALTLDDAYIAVEDLYFDDKFTFTVNNETVNITDLVTVEYTTFGDFNCSQIKEESTEYHAACISCAAGSYFVNGSCVECTEGAYQESSGAFDCEPCPPGTTSPRGAFSRCQCTLDLGDMSNTTEAPPRALSSFTHTGHNPCYLCAAKDNCTDEAPCEPYCRHGICSETGDWVECECFPGYAGARCDVTLHVCDDVDCFNGGRCEMCEDCVSNHTCVCADGFTGEYCEVRTPQCDLDTCLNGYCIEHLDNRSCICDDGWIGDRCDIMVTECSAEYCFHGNCSLAYGHVTCQCEHGYTGERCEYSDDPCRYVTCTNGGYCMKMNGEARCQCEQGFSGEFCEVEVCSNFTCENNATCLLVGNLPLCKCTAGFTGSRCEREVSSDFDLVFNTGHIDDFVSLPHFNTELRELSACVWLRTQDVLHYGTVFSYAAYSNWVNTQDVDVFTLHNYGKLKLTVNGESVETNLALNDGFWHHLCVTWSQSQGQWGLYVNGSLNTSGSDLAMGTYLEAGGYFIIGQNQETIGDGFTQRDTFTGEMHQLNVYSWQMSEEDIASQYKLQCDQPGGDIIAWTHVIGHVTGDVLVRNRSWCLDVNECLRPNPCPDSEVCEDKLEGFTCSRDPCDLTVCHNGGSCRPVMQNKARNTRCLCQPGYIGDTCNILAPSVPSCNTTQCLHGGSCSDLGRCLCPAGYIGTLCEIYTSPCLSEPCANGGSCGVTPAGFHCTCPGPWTGNTCQVRHRGAGCNPNPCLNGGVCEENPDAEEGYVCTCRNENAGYNCESNVCLTSPCHNGGTCIVKGTTTFECACPESYSGDYCDFITVESTTPATTTPQDICRGVNCRNGGTCESKLGGIQCRCTPDYYGQYCSKARIVHEYVYDVQVILQEKYTPSLPTNNSFKQRFINVIHRLYEPELKESKIEVIVTKISEGSVVVDFQVIHTNYTGSKSPDAETMEKILTKQLMTGKLGPWKTDVDVYQFQPQTNTKGASPTVWLTCVIVVLVVVLVSIVGCIWYRKRKLDNAKPMRMNNVPDKVQFRIRNNTQMAGKQPPSPTVQIRMGSGNEGVYSEPYTTSPVGQTNDAGPRFPSKRGLDINQTWGNRQSVPLPPPPEEKPPFAPRVHRRTPPPPYSKSMKVDNANFNPAEANKCSPKDVLYMTPLADDEIAMAKDLDQSYITPGGTARLVNREELENMENEDMYLHPRTDAKEKEVAIDEDDYLMPQSIKSTENELIPSDHESEDEMVTEHSRIYANDCVVADAATDKEITDKKP